MVDYATVNTEKVFHLTPGGVSYEAARRVNNHMQHAIKDMPKVSGSWDKIQNAWQQFNDRQYDALKATDPLVLAATGLDSPLIQIATAPGVLPRAYRSYPMIFTDGLGEPDFYMYAPVDYRGESFHPEDASQLGEQEIDLIGRRLFGEGFGNGAPIFQRKNYGVALPDDFDERTHYTLEQRLSAWPATAFIAAGKSLELVEDYRARVVATESACARVEARLKRILKQDLGAAIRLQLEPKEGFQVDCAHVEGFDWSRPYSFVLSLCSDGKGQSRPHRADQALPLPKNPFFRLAAGTGKTEVLPDSKTPEGAALQKLIDAVPPVPSLGEYPELLGDFPVELTEIEEAIGVNGQVPQLQELRGRSLLVYNCALDGQGSFSPPDAIPLSTAAYIWLQEDETDERRGVKPPPMPQSIKNEITKTFGIDQILGRPDRLPAAKKPELT